MQFAFEPSRACAGEHQQWPPHESAPARRVGEDLETGDQRRQLNAVMQRRERLDLNRATARELPLAEEDWFLELLHRGSHECRCDETASIAGRIVETPVSSRAGAGR
jgi:hypothetical protein